MKSPNIPAGPMNISIPNSDVMIKDFLAGKYDLMGGTYYSESLEQYFAYPDYSCGSTKSVLLARQDDHSIRGYDTMDLNGKTIGVVERAEENIRRLEAFLFLNGIEYTLKRYAPERKSLRDKSMPICPLVILM